MDGGNDRRFIRKHNVLCGIRITGVGQKTPVDIRSVTNIRIVVLGCRSLEHPLHQTLCLLGPFEEELDYGSEDLQLRLGINVSQDLTYQKTETNRGEFFVKSINKATQDITRIADLLGILSNNPDECRSSIRLIQLIDALTQSGDYTLVSRVLSEYVLDDHDRFLNDIVHLCVDQIQQCVDAPLACALNLDSNLADGLDGTPDKVHIDFKGVLLQFSQKLVHVAVVGNPYHDLELLELDIWRVVVFTEENTKFLLENVRLLLQQEVDVSQCHILHFGSRRNQCNFLKLAKDAQQDQSGSIPNGGAIFFR